MPKVTTTCARWKLLFGHESVITNQNHAIESKARSSPSSIERMRMTIRPFLHRIILLIGLWNGTRRQDVIEDGFSVAID